MRVEVVVHFVSAFGAIRPLTVIRFNNTSGPRDLLTWSIRIKFSHGLHFRTQE
jgi:hypothetical protein